MENKRRKLTESLVQSVSIVPLFIITAICVGNLLKPLAFKPYLVSLSRCIVRNHFD